MKKNTKFKRKTKKQFVKDSIKVHGKLYNYSKFIYKSNCTKGIIICKIHGDFIQTPQHHLKGSKCQKCSKLNQIKKVTSNKLEFVKKANKVHNNKYSYKNFKYISAKTNGIITCKIHGDFEQMPNNHLQGRGCQKCIAGSLEKFNLFLENGNNIHNKKYDYRKFKYINAKTKGIIICPIHGDFEQTPSCHLAGQGCESCGILKRSKSKRYNKEKFINKGKIIHDNKYDYSKFIYNGYDENCIIICPIHGNFNQTPHRHLNGSGCWNCAPIKKENEKIVELFLINNNIDSKKQFKIKLPINKPGYYSKSDFYIPSLNLIIEYNGKQHYKPTMRFKMTQKTAEIEFKRQTERDIQLRQYCNNNNINLLEIDGRIYRYKKLHKFLCDFFLNSW